LAAACDANTRRPISESERDCFPMFSVFSLPAKGKKEVATRPQEGGASTPTSALLHRMSQPTDFKGMDAVQRMPWGGGLDFYSDPSQSPR
jgi:hypothetical protein